MVPGCLMCNAVRVRAEVAMPNVPNVRVSAAVPVSMRAARVAMAPETAQRHGSEARDAQQQARDVEVHRRGRV